MKKYISLLMAVLCLCFVSCGDNIGEKSNKYTAKGDGSQNTIADDDHIFVPDITSTKNNDVTEPSTVDISGNFVPDIIDGTEAATKDAADSTKDAPSSDETGTQTDKNELDGEDTTAITVPPAFETIPESGIELPDDVWD